MTKLTSADYNWHRSGNIDNAIALWLLPVGVYEVTSEVATKIYSYSSDSDGTNHLGLFIISEPLSGEKVIYDLGRSPYSQGYPMTAIAVQASNGNAYYSNHNILDSSWIVNGLNSTNANRILAANQGKVLNDKITPASGSGAPTTATVGILGKIYIDATNADAYMCVAVDSVTPSYTWKQITA